MTDSYGRTPTPCNGQYGCGFDDCDLNAFECNRCANLTCESVMDPTLGVCENCKDRIDSE